MLRKLALLVTLMAGTFAAAHAGTTKVPLAVVVNGQQRADVLGWVSEEGLWIAEKDALGWGLSVRADSEVEGKKTISLKGLARKVVFDENELKLTVTLDAAELKGLTSVDLSSQSNSSSTVTQGNGLLLDYSVGAGQAGSTTTWDGSLRTRAAWAGWQLLDTRSAVVLASKVIPGYHQTTLRKDWSAANLRLDLGALELPDGGLGSWSNWQGVSMSSARYGFNALQASRPSTGLTTLVQFPSTADVYVNGVKQGSYAVAPGVFDVRGLRGYASGATQVKAVLRDIYGRETVVEEGRYVPENALESGANDYSYQLGRDDYAPRGGAGLRAVHRYGLNQRLTLTGRLEARKGYAAAQIGAVTQFAGLGEFGANVMTGQDANGMKPRGYSLTHQYSTRFWGTQLALTERPTAVLNAGGTLVNQQIKELSAQASVASKAWGQFSARASATQLAGAARTRQVELGWSKNLTDDLFSQVSLRYNDQGGSSAQVLLVYRPRSGPAINAFTDSSRGHFGQQVSVSSPERDANGRSWRVDARAHDGQASSGASASQQFSAGELGADVYTDGNGSSGRVNWQGAAVFSAAGLSGLPRRSEAAVLVDASGLAGVGVYRNGTWAGKTDPDGTFLMGDLTGYEEVRISLDESDIPMNRWYAGGGTLKVRPAPGSVVPAHFDIREFRDAELSVTVCSPAGCQPAANQAISLTSEGGVQLRAELEGGRTRLEGVLTGAHRLRLTATDCSGDLVVQTTGPLKARLNCPAKPLNESAAHSPVTAGRPTQYGPEAKPTGLAAG